MVKKKQTILFLLWATKRADFLRRREVGFQGKQSFFAKNLVKTCSSGDLGWAVDVEVESLAMD